MLSACDNPVLSLFCKKKREKDVHSLRAVAFVVDGRWDAHHHGWDEVAEAVVILDARALALEDLDQHQVKLDALQTHPGEGSQEAEVENPGNDGAQQLRGSHTKKVTFYNIDLISCFVLDRSFDLF